MKLIAGSGRSGTTWVLDALAGANGLRPVFEPLHQAVSEIGARYAYRALSPLDAHPDLRRFFETIGTDRKFALWTRYRGRSDLLFPSLHTFSSVDGVNRLYRRWRKFVVEAPALSVASRGSVPLVKCIRANLMLGWFARNFGFRPVFIVRHPGAVVESQFRLGDVWNPEPVLNRYRNDARLRELTGNRYGSLLERQLSRIESLTLNWVIENQWPLEQASSDGVTVVFYERLRSAPEREWARISETLDLPKLPGVDVRARPSQQSSIRTRDAAVEKHDKPRWLRSLSHEQLEQMQGILDSARFDLYAMNDIELRETSIDSVIARAAG